MAASYQDHCTEFSNGWLKLVCQQGNLGPPYLRIRELNQCKLLLGGNFTRDVWVSFGVAQQLHFLRSYLNKALDLLLALKLHECVRKGNTGCRAFVLLLKSG